MGRQAETIKRKVTKEGIEVTLLQNTIIKKYSKHYVCFMSFSTRVEAVKEFGKFRHGNNQL